MPSRKLTRSLAMPLSRLLVPAPEYRAGTGAGGANFYSTLFSELSVSTGFVLHGTLSSFYEDSAGTTEATTSGMSPLGQVSDVSGLANNAIQTNSTFKPVFYLGDGIKSFRAGTWPAGVVDHYLRPSTQPGIGSAFTVAFVGYLNTGAEPPQNWGIALTNYDGGWLSGVYVRHGANTTGNFFTLASSGTTETNAATSPSTPRICVIRRAGTGTNQTSIKVYSMAGALLASGTGTHDASGGIDQVIGGYNGVGADPMRFAFLMYANGVDIGTDNEAAVVADLVDTFGGWTGGAP